MRKIASILGVLCAIPCVVSCDGSAEPGVVEPSAGQNASPAAQTSVVAPGEREADNAGGGTEPPSDPATPVLPMEPNTPVVPPGDTPAVPGGNTPQVPDNPQSSSPVGTPVSPPPEPPAISPPPEPPAMAPAAQPSTPPAAPAPPAGMVPPGSAAAGAAGVTPEPAATGVPATPPLPAAGESIVWAIDNLTMIGGHPVEVLGEPKVITDGAMTAVAFDGDGDRLLVDTNPLDGATEFTVEVVFKANDVYPKNAEPRFFHIESEENKERRITLELRLNGDKGWALDTFIKTELTKFTLLDTALTHPVEVWSHAAMTYKDRLFSSYAGGVQELSTEEVEYLPIPASAKTSIGARMNLVNWFNGAIAYAAITHKALTPEQFVLLDKVKAP